MTIPTLNLHHDDTPGAPRFTLSRDDGRRSRPFPLPDPWAMTVPGEVLDEAGDPMTLRWALGFMHGDYGRMPGPFQLRRRRVEETLRAWGVAVMEAIQQNPQALLFLEHARQAGSWCLRVHANDAGILSWPWEVVQSPDHTGPVGLRARVERAVEHGWDPIEPPPDLPTDRLEILLVTARGREGDVPYRAVSGPLVQAVAGHAVHITQLRPPTFDTLSRTLRDNPGRFHLLHFDGHGSVVEGAAVLFFEDSLHQLNAVPARLLAEQLAEHCIPAVVLNACRSGEPGDTADPWSASATALLRGGVREVVAMSHPLSTDGARRFIPDFYEQLLRHGSMGEAARVGRQAMRRERYRGTGKRRALLEDWYLPQVFRMGSFDFSFAREATPTDPTKRLPRAARRTERLRYRELELLALERATDRASLVMLHGPEGVGKTTLARELCTWRAWTRWDGDIDWVDCAQFTSARSLQDRLGAVLGQDALALRGAVLRQGLRRQRRLVVLDGVEALSDEAVDWLGELVETLAGEGTRLLLTGPTDLPALSGPHVRAIPLKPLRFDVSFELAKDLLGRSLDRRKDEDLIYAIAAMRGVPLLIGALLADVSRVAPQALREALDAVTVEIVQGRNRAALNAVREAVGLG
ncbi:MAG: CHAT domain-containing protein [Alphaproteobacteria bacterium]|nr:CHAT domain-containing protein [Alphaproteobacteria bacterium]